MSKKDIHAQLGGNRRLRRRWITWMRMTRYGMNSFTRNLWLTTAATVVMTITLLIIFTTFVARVVLNDTVQNIRSKVDIPINLKSNTSNEKIELLRKKFENHPDVVEVSYISKEETKRNLLDSDKLAADQLKIIAELPDQPYYPVLKLVVRDPSNTVDLERFINDNEDIQSALNTQPGLQPKFSGDRTKSIATISSWASTAEKGGMVAGVMFVAISALIIFNTIRMAIFSRKDEIEMMKLIGADKRFIRGPFVVEAVLYGFFAALIAAGLGISLFLSIEPKLSAYGIATTELHTSIVMYSPLVVLVMVGIGALIGVFSSRLAVRRYLKLS